MQICTSQDRRGNSGLLNGALQKLLLLGFAFLLSLFSLTGCEGCSGSTPMAKLIALSGAVQRDFADKQGSWNSAAEGEEFDVGDAVRTGQKAEARLELDDGSLLVMEEDTMIRFLARPPGTDEHSLDLMMGGAVVEAAQSEATLVTSFGRARLAAGGKIRLVRTEDELSFKVMVGTALLEAEGGEPLSVEAGQSVIARLGSAVLEDVVEQELNQEEDPKEEPAPEGLSGPITAEVRGNSVQVKAPADQRYATLKGGSQTVVSGSLVKVGAGSGVILTQGAATAELSSGGTYVVGADGQLVQAQAGSFKISSEQRLRLAVPGGFIETTAGAAQVTSLGAEGTEVLVESGSALLSGQTKESMSVGEKGRISSDGVVSVEGRGLSYFDLQIGAGASLVIHDPRPPTAVAFHFAKSCEEGVIRLRSKSNKAIAGGQFARGRNTVALLVGPGRVDYTLNCFEDGVEDTKVRAQGALTVLGDAGTKPVPSKAPSTTIDANGRSYTVLYQNQLPRVALRWPSAPAEATSFKIIKTSGGRSRTYSSSASSYTFPSGAFGEGTHRFYFEGGGRVSRLTTVNIVFDNATPTASLQTPVGAGGPPGSSLRLSGSVLPGWAITVDGKTISPDAEGRFSVSTPMPPQGRPALLFLTHPQRGSHVYLRRSAGAR